ncbi:hypothetical protein CYMTET_35843, partial [Cymbomonas tetramitiformis]
SLRVLLHAVVLCAACEDQYRKSSTGGCAKCATHTWLLWVQLALVVLLGTVLVIGGVRVLKLDARQDLVVTVNGMRKQHLSTLLMGVLMGNLQIMAQTTLVFQDKVIPPQYRSMVETSEAINVTPLFSWLQFACLGLSSNVSSFYWQFTFYAVLPFAVAAGFMCLEYARNKGVHLQRSPSRPRRVTSVEESERDTQSYEEWCNLLGGVLGYILVLLHPTCATYMFQLFRCRLVYDHGKQYWLELDHTVECFTSQWWAFAGVSIVVIGVFVFGLPCAIAIVVHYLKGLKKMKNVHSRVTLYVPREELEAVEGSAAGEEVDNPLYRHVDKETGMQTMLEPVYEKDDKAATALAHPRVASMIGPYITPFKRQYYSWAAYDMLRKVLQTSMVTIVQLIDNKYDVLYGCTVTALALALHAHNGPYASQLVNFFQTLVLALQLMTSIIYLGEEHVFGSLMSQVCGMALILAQCTLSAAIAYCMILDLAERYHHTLEEYRGRASAMLLGASQLYNSPRCPSTSHGKEPPSIACEMANNDSYVADIIEHENEEEYHKHLQTKASCKTWQLNPLIDEE